MRARAFVIFTLLLSLPLAACGQKGPLYLEKPLPEEEVQPDPESENSLSNI